MTKTKLERAASLPSLPKTEPVSRAESSAPVESELRPVAGPREFEEPAPPPPPGALPLSPHVARSAEPGALWGAEGGGRRYDFAAFKRLPHAEQAAKLESMKAQREALKGDIQARLTQLDGKWKYAHLRTRTNSLSDLKQRQPELAPELRKAFDIAVEGAVSAEQKVKHLAEKAKRFVDGSRKDPAQSAARKELAGELRQARKAQSKAVAEATAVADQAGLKVERLAVAEQALDKTAPKEGSGHSLLEKIASFFDLSWGIQMLTGIFKSLTDEMNKQQERRTESAKEDREAELRIRRQLERQNTERISEHSREVTRAALLQELLPERLSPFRVGGAA